MRAESDEAKVETDWMNLKRPNLGDDGGESCITFSPFFVTSYTRQSRRPFAFRSTNPDPVWITLHTSPAP
jgi:hypothetical protein